MKRVFVCVQQWPTIDLVSTCSLSDSIAPTVDNYYSNTFPSVLLLWVTSLAQTHKHTKAAAVVSVVFLFQLTRTSALITSTARGNS